MKELETEFPEMDKDASGFLEQAELEAEFGEDDSWKEHDNDGDGKLSKEELVSMLQMERADVAEEEEEGEEGGEEGEEEEDEGEEDGAEAEEGEDDGEEEAEEKTQGDI